MCLVSGGSRNQIRLPDGGILATGNIGTDDFPGDLFVWLLKIGSDGCYESDCDDLELVITPTVEMPLPEHPYRLFPNPGLDFFYIEGLTGTEELALDIINTAGQLVQHIPKPQPGKIHFK